MSKWVDISCEDAGCQKPGHFRRREQTGEHLIMWTAWHGKERHVANIRLAEEAARAFKTDKAFREYLLKLLDG